MSKITLISLVILCCIKALGQDTADFETGYKKLSPEKLILKFQGKERLLGAYSLVDGLKPSQDLDVYKKETDGVSIFSLKAKHSLQLDTKSYAGLFFRNISTLEKAVAIWRYKPWNSWTKPIALTNGAKMPHWDVQFYYWKDKDGTYGAAVPLSGNGYRTTLGSQNAAWGCKTSTLTRKTLNGYVGAVAISFGTDPYELFNRIYRVALQAMNKGMNLRTNKNYPEEFKYFGWCTYNAVQPAAEPVIEAVKSFKDQKFPIGFVLIDGGWMQSDNQQLQAQTPDKKLLPGGFKEMNTRLKSELGVRYCGIWHTLDGDFNGIDSSSALARHYKGQLFSWLQPTDPSKESSPLVKHYWIKPESDSLNAFWHSWYKDFKNQGFDFTKIDNQLIPERMAPGNYPVLTLSKVMHEAIYKASKETFQGVLINCMDMTADAYLNFGTSAVARDVEDYFPYSKDETYNLQRGNAAAHVLQAIYNNLYFSQMVYTDFDMFQSHNPNAYIHAIARACNNGPVYCTDIPGKQNFEILRPLIYEDGRVIHSETPLMPSPGSLFQVQGKQLFKAFSMVGSSGLLMVMNAADTQEVSGTISAADVTAPVNKQFICYEYFTKSTKLMGQKDKINVSIARLAVRLYEFIPLKQGFAAIGLTEKYNAPATILSESSVSGSSTIELYEGGLFKAYSVKRPKKIEVDGKPFYQYKYTERVLAIEVPNATSVHPKVKIYW